MDENMTITVCDEEGHEMECEVLFTYEDPDTGKNYIVYTPGDLDQDGDNDIFASIYDPDNEESDLSPIETDAEWEMIEKLLDQIQTGE